ncbi:MAG: DUF4160 domain-containing protein [Clostridia bacterium]|nr:DUF4160 domain-containing protein [Clostridia bacterium]
MIKIFGKAICPNRIVLRAHYCGMSDKTFTPKIMIYKPVNTINYRFNLKDCKALGLKTIIDLIEYIKSINTDIHLSWINDINLSSVYVFNNGYLLGVKENKSLQGLFKYFNKSTIYLDYFFVAGGASLHYWGYTFTINSNERNHKHQPHIHVSIDGIATRYSLLTYNRFPKDKYSKHHKKDEKKIIKPFIEEHSKELLELWYHNMNGYSIPVIDENGCQYYKES